MDDAERLKRVIKQNRRLKRILTQCWDAAGLLCARMTGKPHQAWNDSDDLVDQIEELAELADNAREAEDMADALAARVAGLEGVLREVEWEGHKPRRKYGVVDGLSACPCCGEGCEDGHAPDCRLAAALAPATPAPQWTVAPPTEPGWYWAATEHGTRRIVNVVRNEGDEVVWRTTGYEGPLSEWALWWPVPLALPPAPGRAGEGGEG